MPSGDATVDISRKLGAPLCRVLWLAPRRPKGCGAYVNPARLQTRRKSTRFEGFRARQAIAFCALTKRLTKALHEPQSLATLLLLGAFNTISERGRPHKISRASEP